jgi:hypothetical protein
LDAADQTSKLTWRRAESFLLAATVRRKPISRSASLFFSSGALTDW